MSISVFWRRIGLFTFVIILILSCSDNSLKKDNQGSESVVVDKNLQICETAVMTYFDKLGSESYDECIEYFSDSLLNSIGKDKIVEELKSRNIQNGIPDSLQIYYISENENLYTVNIRCFKGGTDGKLTYEKIGVRIIENKPEFITYDYSKTQYCDLQMANDTVSEINDFLQEVYYTLTYKDADAAFKLLDPEVVASLKKEFFEEKYQERKLLFSSKSTFVVKSVWAEINRGIPVLNFILESNCADSKKYVDEIMISDRFGKYYLASIDRQLKTEAIVQQLPRPSESELKPFAAEVSLFYNLLGENKSEQIVEKIDKVVFVNNDYSTVKNSFSARNQYYGKPISLNNTNVKAYSVDGNTVVDFNFSVENSTGKKSYEKVSVIRKENSKYLIYGYDYRDQPF